jgi:hypothetical protein
MGFFEMVWRSPGFIFGPLMILGGVVAIVMCARATFRPDRASARRALMWSLVPPALGAVGALVGAVVFALADRVNKDWATAAQYLGCTIVFGVFCAFIPFPWSLALIRRRPAALA